MEDRAVLAPGGEGRQASGILKQYTKWRSTDWEVSVDLEVDDLYDNESAKGGFNLYFLHTEPDTETVKRDYAQFGKGLVTDEMEGVWIDIRQRPSKKGEDESKYHISLHVYNHDHILVNEPMLQSCEVYFDRATIRIMSEQATTTIMLEVLPYHTFNWIPCFEFNRAAVDYANFFYLTTAPQKKTEQRKAHYIHSIHFYDNEPDDEPYEEYIPTHEMTGPAGGREGDRVQGIREESEHHGEAPLLLEMYTNFYTQ